MAKLITLGSRPGRPQTPNVKRPSERRSLSRSATRALDVLEHFSNVRQPLRAIEISRALEIHPSTTDQLLKTMVDSAYIIFNSTHKTYLPSPRLIGFSSWIVEMYGADERLRDLVRDVQARTDMSVTLTTPNDLFMQIIELAMPAGQRTERGLRISVFGSAVGSAYLSTLDGRALERLAERARIPAGEMPTILQAVASIRREGFADGCSFGQAIWSIAVPLPAQGLSIPMVLGLAGQAEAIQWKSGALYQEMRTAIGRWILNR